MLVLLAAHGFLLVFEGGPQLLQLWGDRRPRQLQGLEDVSGVAHLVLCDEGVGKTLRRQQGEWGGADEQENTSP